MSSFARLLQGVVDLYYAEVKLSEKQYDRDKRSATMIQAKYRMYRFYKHYQRNRQAAITIQKHIRSYLARCVFAQRLSLRSSNFNKRYFSTQATIIQRYYRGYMRRKYFHDFYARKEYLTFLRTKNDNFLEDLQQKAKQERIDEEERNLDCAKQEFIKLATNLHHLASTKQQPGIYKPPFAPQPPKVFEIEVETHIRDAFKSSYKWKPPSSATVRSTSGNRQTQQASSGYRIRPGTQQQAKRVK